MKSLGLMYSLGYRCSLWGNPLEDTGGTRLAMSIYVVINRRCQNPSSQSLVRQIYLWHKPNFAITRKDLGLQIWHDYQIQVLTLIIFRASAVVVVYVMMFIRMRYI